MHLKSIPILPEQLGVPSGDQRLNLRRLADREGPTGTGRLAAGGMGGREKWSGFAWLSQDGKSRPLSNGIQPKNGREAPGCSRAANPDHPGRPNGRKPTRKETTRGKSNGRKPNRKKGAAGGDPCRRDELFAWHAVTPPQAPPRRAPQRAPRPQRARCRDTPSLPGWTRKTWPHR